MRRRTSPPLWSGGLLGILLSLAAPPLLAHAVAVEARVVPGIALQARYDSGEPMAQAQVVIYRPNQPMTPAQIGLTDAQGRFQFVPTPAEEGVWSLQVRQAGHGAMVHLPMPLTAPEGEVVPAVVAVAGFGQLTIVQKIVMALSIVWGLIGTALFFYARRTPNAPS